MYFSPLLSALFLLILLPQGDADYYSPSGRDEAMAALISDEIYYYGGFDGSVLDDFFYIDLTLPFIVSDLPYQLRSNLNQRGGASSIVYENTIYIFGGYNDSGNTDILLTIKNSSSSNPSVQTIQNTEFTVWPSARKWHTAVIDYVSANMYIWGGTKSASPDDTQSDGKMYVFNIANNTWSSNPVSNQPTGRQLHTATLLPDGRILIIGGYYTTDIAELDIYNTNTGQWSNVIAAKHGTIPTRCGHTATLLPDNKTIIVFGGYSQYESVAYYDLATLDTTDYIWSVVSSTGNIPATSPYSHTAILSNNYIIFALGAVSNSQFLNEINILDISNDQYKWIDIFTPPITISSTLIEISPTIITVSLNINSNGTKVVPGGPDVIGNVLEIMIVIMLLGLLGIFCCIVCKIEERHNKIMAEERPRGRPENLVDYPQKSRSNPEIWF